MKEKEQFQVTVKVSFFMVPVKCYQQYCLFTAVHLKEQFFLRRGKQIVPNRFMQNIYL